MSDEQLEQLAPWNETVKAQSGNYIDISLPMQYNHYHETNFFEQDEQQ